MRRIVAGMLCLLVLPCVARAESLVIGHQAATDYLPAYVAQQRGIFARHGIEATLQPVPNGGQIPAALVSGSVQVGTLTTVLLVQAASQGLPIGCIAGGSVLAPGVRVGAALICPGVALRNPGDFAGHVVGVSAIGSFLQMLFAQWLRDGGADPAGVRYVEAPFPQLGDVLKSGRVDAALLVEPFAARAEHSVPGATTLPYLDHFPPGTLINAYCVANDWARAHGATIAGFRAALDEAIAAIRADPDAARADIGTWLKLPPELVATLPIPAFDAHITAPQIAAWTAMAATQGLVDRRIDPCQRTRAMMRKVGIGKIWRVA